RPPPVSLGGRYLPCGRRWRALLGSWRIPLEACPELETPAAPYVLTLPAVRVQPSARITASASAPGSISELNLRGLLPCCVRFAPTGHPVNGNTGYRPAGPLWAGGTRPRWIPLRGFTGSFSAPPLPSFSQRDMRINSKCAHQPRPPLE